MAVFRKSKDMTKQEFVVYSAANRYKKGQVQAVVDAETGQGIGQAECVGNMARDPRLTVERNGKTYPYGKFYWKFRMRG